MKRPLIACRLSTTMRGMPAPATDPNRLIETRNAAREETRYEDGLDAFARDARGLLTAQAAQ